MRWPLQPNPFSALFHAISWCSTSDATLLHNAPLQLEQAITVPYIKVRHFGANNSSRSSSSSSTSSPLQDGKWKITYESWFSMMCNLLPHFTWLFFHSTCVANFFFFLLSENLLTRFQQLWGTVNMSCYRKHSCFRSIFFNVVFGHRGGRLCSEATASFCSRALRICSRAAAESLV